MVQTIKLVFSNLKYLLLSFILFSSMMIGLLILSEYIFLEPYIVSHIPSGTELEFILIFIISVLSALVIPMNIFRINLLKASRQKMGGGIFGSMLSTPIINAPQSAILGMHNIVERPVAINGQVEIRPIMYVALSYDHRIIDGKESVGFLVAVKEALENPVELLMDNNTKKALEL